ncbi:MAG: hypothetical protein WCY29_05930 [Novosphingobium sp.]
MTPNYLYRVVEHTYSTGVDESGYPLPGGPTHASLHMIPVLKETPRGWWVSEDRRWRAGSWRWVSKDRAIPYACLTVEEAVAAWKKRVRWRVRVLRKQIDRLVEAEMSLASGGFYFDERRWTDPTKPDLLVRAARGDFSEVSA